MPNFYQGWINISMRRWLYITQKCTQYHSNFLNILRRLVFISYGSNLRCENLNEKKNMYINIFFSNTLAFSFQRHFCYWNLLNILYIKPAFCISWSLWNTLASNDAFGFSAKLSLFFMSQSSDKNLPHFSTLEKFS